MNNPSATGHAERMLALVRLVALPVIFFGERLVAHPEASSGPFGEVLFAAALYAVAAFAVVHTRAGPRIPLLAYAGLDLAFLCALTYTSGGPFSQMRFAFFLVPLVAAVLMRPWPTAAVSMATILAYLAISLLHPAGGFGSAGLEAAQAFYLMWTGISATLFSHMLTRRNESIDALAASRGRLVAQALDAEDRERRRLAEALHDDAIQNLLAARQELAAANGGIGDVELVRAGLDRTISQLREAVFELHPYVLEHTGLRAGLEAVAERYARRGGFRFEVDVDPSAVGTHDRLLFSVARELIANAAKHANARLLTVSVRRDDADVVLEVADDGRGFEAPRLEEALRSGHIGLASCVERVEALGGDLQITSSRGRGTVVRVGIPTSATSADRTTAGRVGQGRRGFLRQHAGAS